MAKAAAKKAAPKKSTAKKSGSSRTTIAPSGDKRYIRRNENGQIKESDDVGRSLSKDVQQHSKKAVKAGQGDRGDQAAKRAPVKKAAAKKAPAKKAAPKKK